jgi:putative FmdB family regulatory protein
MPIYQYDCDDCTQRVEVFFRSVRAVGTPVCPHCDSKNLKRVMSRFARVRSDTQQLDDLDIEQQLGRLDGKSEADFARWTRRMGNELGEDLGADFRDMADRADAGADPIERVDPAHTLKFRVNKKREEAAGDSGAE